MSHEDGEQKWSESYNSKAYNNKEYLHFLWYVHVYKEHMYRLGTFQFQKSGVNIYKFLL